MLLIRRTYNFLCKHYPLIIILLTIVFWTFMYVINTNTNRKSPDITEVPSTNIQDIRESLPEASESEAKDITKRIQKTKEESAPTYHYYTRTQEDADKKAQEYAQKQGADKVLKDTKTREIEGTGKETNKKDSIIENNYYALNMERKHNISVGSMYVDHNSYVTASYRNRDVTYTALYGVNNHKVGVGVSVTVAKW